MRLDLRLSINCHNERFFSYQMRIFVTNINTAIMLKFNNLKSIRLSILIGTCFLFLSTIKVFSQKNLAEKLGYDKDAKLLIIHADDLGMAHSENSASIKAIDSGSVNSASIMMPAPWVEEVAAYARKNSKRHDLGLHLVLTSEWENYRWGPVASKDKVASLLAKDGYFYKDCSSKAKPEEVETELRAQIDLAYVMGIEPTHLDSHMGCMFWINKGIFEVYLTLGQEYKLPCLVDKSFVGLYADEETFLLTLKKYEVAVVVDHSFTISPNDFSKGTIQYYTSVLKSLQPGLSTFLIHTAYDTVELKAITINHPDWGATWRQADYDFFMSAECNKILEQEEIILVTWREISNALN